MPFYEYDCAGCGVFSAFKPMVQYQEPQPCPACHVLAPRIVVTAPACSVVPGSTRKAHALNERSAHEPKRTMPGAAGHDSHRARRASRAPGPAGGTRGTAGTRPWMIGH